jgi:hypothetical protein
LRAEWLRSDAYASAALGISASKVSKPTCRVCSASASICSEPSGRVTA